ncbi:MAG: cytochrome c4 [Proteobacteria bacterium]|nr:cytochrome c4 [Pseudomonadota bacterium]
MKTHALAASLIAALLCLGAQANEAAPAKAKPDLARGGEIAAQVCAACHTSDGSRGAPANPIIAGQIPEYLSKQLHEFKSGVRANAIMSGMVAGLNEADMANVAAFYASKSAKPGFAKEKDLVLLGEKIYRGGIMDKHVPACAGCHGPTGAGIPSQYPRLSGQHADYTDAQLKGFRAGTRKNSVQMVPIAARMSDVEIKAVSDYIAGLH